MTLSAIRTGLQARLQTIKKLKVYDRPPDSINQFPAAIIVPLGGLYDYAMNTGIRYQFEVTLLVARQELVTAQEILDPYIDRSGTNSIYAAIDGDTTLGGECSECRIAEFRDYGGLSYGGHIYLGVKFIIEVYSL